MNWLTLLQTNQLPATSANEIVVDGFKRVEVNYSRPLTEAEQKTHHRLLLSYSLGNWESIRAHRNNLLISSDWTQAPDAVLTIAEQAAWQDYRQALRDIPQNFINADDVVMPIAPNEVA